MRLRYLHIPELPPLHDIEITFGHEQILGRQCTIHFIAGVNGSGKSRLLRALAEIFLSLDQAEVPPFPVTIAYDLERGQGTSQSRHTIYYRYTGRGKNSSYMVVLEQIPLNEEINWSGFHLFDWTTSDDEALPYRKRRYLSDDSIAEVKSYLPTCVLAYTSGSAHEWEKLFMPPARSLEERQDLQLPQVEQNAEDRRQNERPARWSNYKEAIYRQSQQVEESAKMLPASLLEVQSQERNLSPGENLYPGEHVFPGDGQQPGIGIFIQPEMLKLVVCAVALSQALEEFQQYPTERDREAFEQTIERAVEQREYMGGMRAIFNAVDWLWPITVGLQIVWQPERLQAMKKESSLLRKLYLIASKVIRGSEPGPTESRTLYFDLTRIVQLPTHKQYHQKSTLEALADILGGVNTQAFDIFKQLLELQKRNILEDATIALKKRKVGGILLYDQLSDGERVLLGRMALFHLLKGTDDTLIVLDEPETHFNDVWKREVVDMIDNALRNDTSEIVLSTHSSIALTDVFNTEITLLQKNSRDATVYAVRPTTRSFGASPDDILHDIFGASDSVGQRASEFLDLILIATAHWEQAQQILNGDEKRRDEAFDQLKQSIREQSSISIAMQEENELHAYLLKTLEAVRSYTQQKRGQVNAESILDVLQERLGSGYYQFEFRRRLRALRKDSNAASN
ncbi:MAG TPA: AAA family ATPase [Ktedonobacteraceae bacterium]|nr:AAA family ATPase [Ktedonobacteraceae bacterium]